MGKHISSIILSIILIVALASCATAPKYTSYVSIKGADCPQAEFASGDIMAQLDADGIGISDVDASWTIRFAQIDPSLGEQAYRVEVLGKIIEITGGDEKGLMYGGLEVAEQIELYGIEGVKTVEAKPYVLVRGTKVNIPMDLRTPSYTDGGLSGQSNMDDMWDIDFWHAYIEGLARDRINAISLWSLDPFPSMVKVPEYPDVALDDVWRTKVEIGTIMGNRTDSTKPEHYADIEVVKEITIEEKIEFWREVMQYAADHGVDFYIYTWNIYTFAEEGKYGITDLLDNKVTEDYFRCSVREMVKTYPLLKGIGITAGENMVFEGGTMGAELGNMAVETWLWNTYGLGINEALAEDPDRDFQLLHRLHYADFDNIADLWKDFKGDFHYSEKYSIGRMISGTNPTFVNPTYENMPADVKCYLELRQDDMFHLKFGDSYFMREYILGMPPQNRLDGMFLGSDDYVHCIDSSYVDEDFNDNLYIDNHWILFTLYGRLGYDPYLSDEYIAELLTSRYGGHNGTLLLQAMNDAYEGMRLHGTLIWFTGAQMYWEGSLENGGSYYGVNLLMKNRVALQDCGLMTMNDTALALKDGSDTSGYDMTALDVIDKMLTLGQKTIDEVALLKKDVVKGIDKQTEKEWKMLLADEEALGYLTLYYGEKLNGSMLLRRYNDTGDTSFKDQSVEALTRALGYWRQYVDLFATNYTRTELMCQGWYRDLDAVEPFILQDIETARTWKIRPIK